MQASSMGLVGIPERARQGLQWKDVLNWLKTKEEENPDQLDFPVMVPFGEQIFIIDPSESEDTIFGPSVEIDPFFVGWYRKVKKNATQTHLVKRGDMTRRPICGRRIAKPTKRFVINSNAELACEGCKKALKEFEDGD